MCVHQLQQSSLSICRWVMVAGLNLTGPSPNAGLQAIEGNLSTALPGLAVLQDRATGDCAEPSRINLQKELAMRADLVITGQLRKTHAGWQGLQIMLWTYCSCACKTV
jgi:hypothetical protein